MSTLTLKNVKVMCNTDNEGQKKTKQEQRHDKRYSSSEHQVFKKFLARLSFPEIYPFQKISACLYRHQKNYKL